MTNFEWIKSLDKNAMSNFLCSDVPCVYCAEKGNMEGCDSTCLNGILLWLEGEYDASKLSYWLEEEHDADKR